MEREREARSRCSENLLPNLHTLVLARHKMVRQRSPFQEDAVLYTGPDAAHHNSRGGPFSSSSSSSGTSGRTLKLVLFLCAFAGVYYYVSMQEEKSILSFGSQWNSSTTKKGVIPEARLKDDAVKEFILKPRSEFTPAIVWLMSFPNSGTSYTMTMVARSTGRAFATNYGDEVIADDEEETLPIYPRRPEGPYWSGLSGKRATPRPLPDRYVITKTHCGSRCIKCGPDEYIETPEFFLKRCASGHGRFAPNRRHVDVEYPPERVAKAIHLIRNPFHNIIARYHLEHRHYQYKNQTDWLKKHENDKKGLQKYCKDLDDEYKKQDEEFFGKGKVPKAICHGELYKWTQWHNLVHEGLKQMKSLHEVPVLTIYYEDYSTKFNETVAEILGFLELENIGELREFSARSDYDGYFTEEQLQHAKSLVKSVASDKTWSQIEHYFQDS